MASLARLFSPHVLGALPTEHHATIRSTTLRVVGAYAAWFSASTIPAHEDGDDTSAATATNDRSGASNNSEALLLAVTFVVHGLSDPMLAPAAARALRQLCDTNRRALTPHVASFVAVLGGLEQRVRDDELLTKVLESVANVVQALPEPEIVEPVLVSPLGELKAPYIDDGSSMLI